MSKQQRPEKMTAPGDRDPKPDVKDVVAKRSGVDDDRVIEPVYKLAVPEDGDKDLSIGEISDKDYLPGTVHDGDSPITEVEFVSDSIISPRDSASGQATGRRQFEPVVNHGKDHKGDIGGRASDVAGVDALNYEVKLTHGIKDERGIDGPNAGIDFPSLEAEADDEFVEIDFGSLEAEADDEFVARDFPSLEAEADDEFVAKDFPSLEAEADDEFIDSQPVTTDLTYQKIESVVIEELPQDFTESTVWQDDWNVVPGDSDGDDDGVGLDG